MRRISDEVRLSPFRFNSFIKNLIRLHFFSFVFTKLKFCHYKQSGNKVFEGGAKKTQLYWMFSVSAITIRVGKWYFAPEFMNEEKKKCFPNNRMNQPEILRRENFYNTVVNDNYITPEMWAVHCTVWKKNGSKSSNLLLLFGVISMGSVPWHISHFEHI